MRRVASSNARVPIRYGRVDGTSVPKGAYLDDGAEWNWQKINKERENSNIWWTRGDSNPRPPRCERGALPTELLAHRHELFYQTHTREQHAYTACNSS